MEVFAPRDVGVTKEYRSAFGFRFDSDSVVAASSRKLWKVILGSSARSSSGWEIRLEKLLFFIAVPVDVGRPSDA
jgi:hypothetical protein